MPVKSIARPQIQSTKAPTVVVEVNASTVQHINSNASFHTTPFLRPSPLLKENWADCCAFSREVSEFITVNNNELPKASSRQVSAFVEEEPHHETDSNNNSNNNSGMGMENYRSTASNNMSDSAVSSCTSGSAPSTPTISPPVTAAHTAHALNSHAHQVEFTHNPYCATTHSASFDGTPSAYPAVPHMYTYPTYEYYGGYCAPQYEMDPTAAAAATTMGAHSGSQESFYAQEHAAMVYPPSAYSSNAYTSTITPPASVSPVPAETAYRTVQYYSTPQDAFSHQQQISTQATESSACVPRMPPCRFPVPPPPLKARRVLSEESFYHAMLRWFASIPGWDPAAPSCPPPKAFGGEVNYGYEEWLHMVDDWYMDNIVSKNSYNRQLVQQQQKAAAAAAAAGGHAGRPQQQRRRRN